MRPQKCYLAIGRALVIQKRTGALIADPHNTWEKEVARVNEAGVALSRYVARPLNAAEYDKGPRGTAVLDPIALALLRPRGMPSVDLVSAGNMEPEDEPLLRGALEILQEGAVDKIRTEELVSTLVRRSSPWAKRWESAIADGNMVKPARHLASRLRVYGVNPRTIRIGPSVRKGYRIDDLRAGLSRYERAQENPDIVPLFSLRTRSVRSNPEFANLVLRRVGVLGSFVEKLKNDREFLKYVLRCLDPHLRSLQDRLKRLRKGEGFRITYSALPANILTDPSREAMGIRNEVSNFERAGWRLRWCVHKRHLYVGTGRGRLPIDCPAHRYGGRKDRAKSTPAARRPRPAHGGPSSKRPIPDPLPTVQ